MSDASQKKPPCLPRSLNDLPRPCARLCLDVRRFLAAAAGDALSQSTPVLVAFSGGADSTALALMLHCLGLPVCLGHLDHGLRPESAAEAEAAVRFAQGLGVPCLTERIDVGMAARTGRMGIEEAGRRARYRFLEQARRDCSADWIATGHHLDDLGEDVLMRLVRGTGWPGLGGMRAMDAQRRLLRPLLAVRRQEITAFLERLGIPWLEDPSNSDPAYTRNRMRAALLPMIKKENPAFSDAVQTLWQLARDDEAYWTEQLAPVMAQVQTGEQLQKVLPDAAEDELPAFFLPRPAFIHLPRAARLRVYMALLRKGLSEGRSGQAQANTLFKLDEACMRGRARKSFQLPGSTLIVSDSLGLALYYQP